MKNEIYVMNEFSVIETFMNEMLLSQENGELSSFVLAKWDFFVDSELGGDYEKMDIITRVARACISKSDCSLYNMLTADILRRDPISVPHYEEEIKKLEESDEVSVNSEIENLRASLEEYARENSELKESVARSETLVMEALDMMMH